MLYRDHEDGQPDAIFVTGTPTLALSIYRKEYLALFETESRFETELKINQVDSITGSEIIPLPAYTLVVVRVDSVLGSEVKSEGVI